MEGEREREKYKVSLEERKHINLSLGKFSPTDLATYTNNCIFRSSFFPLSCESFVEICVIKLCENRTIIQLNDAITMSVYLERNKKI